MKSDRMVTRACAGRDWGRKTGLDVLEHDANDPLLKVFVERPLDAELAEHNELNRQRAWEKAEEQDQLNRYLEPPATSGRSLGKLTIEGRRAVLWADDGSAYDGDIGGDVVWLILAGKRESGSASNVYEKYARLLGDGTDPWLPTSDDYADLFELRDERQLEEARQRISEAASAAAEDPNHRIPIQVERLDEVSVAEAQLEEKVNGFVVDALHMRIFVVSKFYADTGALIEEEYAVALAGAAFDDEMEWGAVAWADLPLPDWDDLDPFGVYCYAAELP